MNLMCEGPRISNFFSNFRFSCHDYDREGGYRCKICTVPTPFLCLPDPLEWEETATYLTLSSNPSFSRAGRADTKTVWEPYRSCTDTLPLDHNRDEKKKNREKWTE